MANLLALTPGAQFGAYDILSTIGAGGMGEVYRARDRRLKRDVALKVLPESFTTDPDRLARFQREAEVLAALNHPHIAHIHGVEDSGGASALILEFVDGLTLADRIAQGPVALEEAVPIARQIAEALEAAHECGIVHRDLKPANVKLRPDGTVKVLDFGLAKAVGRDAERSGLSDSPTVTVEGTHAGTILGTAPYMSPEQAKGRAVDKRTDIWAFGAVLYELLTGKAAFRGSSVAETLSQVLTQAPNWELLPGGTPASIRTLLRRCLEKNPARRLDSAVAVRLEIDDALTSSALVTTASGAENRRRRVTREAIIALAVGSVIAALGMWLVMRNRPQQATPPIRFTITFPPTEPLELTFRGRDIALSPDGRYLVYQSRNRLMVRALDQLDAVPLSGVASGRTPFFSPDSRWIGFFDGGDLKKVAVTGEPVVTLCRNLGSPEGGTWGSDGTIVISSEDGSVGLMRVSDNGGEATALTKTTAAQNGHRSPSMLPGGRGVLFTISANTLEEQQLAVLDLKSGQQKTLLRGGVAAQYLDTGHLVYATVSSRGPGPVSGTLWAVGFDLDRLALRGEPVHISETLQIDMLAAPNYVISSTGTLAYMPARAHTRSFVWVDRNGHEMAITGLPPRAYQTIGLSPDGTRLAFAIEDRPFDIWVWDIGREVLSRMTFGPSLDWLPRWTPDGRRLIFRSDRDGPYNLYSVPSDGSGQVERLTTSDFDQYPNSVTPDGTTVLTCELRPKTGFDILRFPAVVAPERSGFGLTPAASAAMSLVSSPSAEYAANISPDGRYFAYQSAESGRFAIYVKPYPDVDRARWQVSMEGGTAPVWSRKGGELFYLDESNTLIAVPVETSGPQFKFGKAAKVFETTYSGDFYSYDVTPDGQRFLMMKQSEPGDRSRPTSMVVVANWLEELKQRAPMR
jgi:serine/threonine protein kinase/Tol biopolymer transport system component